VSASEAPRLPRRRLLAAGVAAWALQVRPAAAVSTPLALQEMVRQWAGRVPVTEGRVLLDVAALVENGNAVPIEVRVDSPMTEADHVQEIVVFNERNPQRDVARFTLTPASGRAVVATRIRLSTSQRLVALARLSDGSQWSHHVEVVVTLAACVEG
jgi:sulfur-oxidizing protein SoxY